MNGLVAVLGAGGGVGLHTARQLMRSGARLRLGARRPETVRSVVSPDAGTAGATAEVVAVDLWDDAALAAFCAGASVVVNCAGPSYEVVDRVALAALASGAHYVDPGGDVPLWRALSHEQWAGRGLAAVINAGLMPGLTSVLPHWLADGLVERRSLTAYVGLLDRMTPVGAAEYLLTLAGEHGEAMAAWREGRRRSRALGPASGVRVPFFSSPVDLQPYLSLETERLASSLGLSDVDWWNVFDGEGHVLRTLARLQADGPGGDLAASAAVLCEAAELDLFGRTPYQTLVFQLDGVTGDGIEERHTALLRGTDTYALTAAVASFSASRLLEDAVPPGAHHVQDAVEADALCAWLREQPEVTVLERFTSPTTVDGTAERSGDGHDVEEGVL